MRQQATETDTQVAPWDQIEWMAAWYLRTYSATLMVCNDWHENSPGCHSAGLWWWRWRWQLHLVAGRIMAHGHACVRACVRAYVHACMHACMHVFAYGVCVCVCACVRACMRACVCVRACVCTIWNTEVRLTYLRTYLLNPLRAHWHNGQKQGPSILSCLQLALQSEPLRCWLATYLSFDYSLWKVSYTIMFTFIL